MRTATLQRGPSTDEGTFGTFTADNGWTCATIELPWRDNAHDISCIPPGFYLLQWDFSPREGWCYHYRAVPKRDCVLLHAANVAGDVAKGYVSQLLGCTAPGADKVLFASGACLGKGLTLARDQHGVGASKVTLAALQAQFRGEDGKQQDFTLTVKEA